MFCEIRRKATTDSEIIRPLIPRNSTTDSDFKATTFLLVFGMGGRIKAQNRNRWTDNVGMCCQHNVLGVFLMALFLRTGQNQISLRSIKKLLFKEVCFVTKENAHA